MLDKVTSTRVVLQGCAAEFEPCLLTHEQAARAVAELGVIRRLAEGMLAKAAKRVADTAPCRRGAERDGAEAYARAAGVELSEARRAIGMEKRLDDLPETAAAVRDGRLSTREAAMIADAAVHDPSVEHELLDAAAQGMVPLKDACVAARAHTEDEGVRAARQHAARRWRMWTAADGMVEGHFRLTPEVGGQVKAAIDAGVQRIFRARRKHGPHESHEAYAADAAVELLLVRVDANGDTATGTDANGGDANGTDANGTDANGTDANGTDANGTDANGTDANGTDANGTDANGTDANGTDANGGDATATDVSGEANGGAEESAPARRAGGAPRSPVKGVSTTCHVVIDHAALVRGNALPGERCEIPGVGPVNVEWVRSRLGEAFVTAVVKKGRDITTVAHFGRQIPAHLRTAMIVGGRECDIEGCHDRGYLELDHSEIDFAKHGPAAWWNLGWCCSVHHDRKTRGWTLGPRDPHTSKRTLTPPSRAGPKAA